MSALLKILPPGDPAKPWWTYEDLAAHFGTAQVRRLMPRWEAQGFPAPLPYNTRQKRWRPPAVISWGQRFEIRVGATAPQLVRA